MPTNTKNLPVVYLSEHYAISNWKELWETAQRISQPEGDDPFIIHQILVWVSEKNPVCEYNGRKSYWGECNICCTYTEYVENRPVVRIELSPTSESIITLHVPECTYYQIYGVKDN